MVPIGSMPKTNITVIVIAKDQSDSDMLSLIKNYGTTIRVIDRTEGDLGIGWDHSIRNCTGDGFLAGRMRELGINFVLKLDLSIDGILFLDGDRLPNCDFTEAINEHPDCPILFSAEVDNRLLHDEWVDVTHACYEAAGSPFYSCAMYVPIKAIKTCIDRHGSCFDSEFDGNWGEEDRHFGDRLAWDGNQIWYAPHKYHVSGEVKDRYQDGYDNHNFFVRRYLCKEMVATIPKINQAYIS